MTRTILGTALPFSVTATSVFGAIRWLVPAVDGKIASLSALLFALTVCWILDPAFARNRPAREPRLPTGLDGGIIGLNWPLALGIVLANGLLGIGAGVLVADRLAFPDAGIETVPMRTLFVGSIATNVVVTQVAGWVLQAFLTFLVVAFLDGRAGPRYYFQLVGVSYVGYLLLTVFLAFYNAAVLPPETTLEHLQQVAADHRFDFYARAAEYLVLALVGTGVYLRERFGLFKSMGAAVLPSLLLLALTTLFRWLIQS